MDLVTPKAGAKDELLSDKPVSSQFVEGKPMLSSSFMSYPNHKGMILFWSHFVVLQRCSTDPPQRLFF
jgi:hypothetical protein